LSEDEAATATRSAVSLRLCDRDGALVAVGEFDPALGLVKPRVVMGVEAD